MRIAVYSGSFDPLHIGHLAIMERLTQTREFDWVYLVISPQNPFKEADKALSAERRGGCGLRTAVRPAEPGPPASEPARPGHPSGAGDASCK